jgi:hypothetical protein
MAKSKADDGTWSPATCDRLEKLSAQRETAKNKEKDLIQERKELDGQMDTLGAGESKEILKTRSRYVVVIRAIDWWRDRQKSLADKIDTTIKGARQRHIWDNADLDFADPAETELFAPPPEPEIEPEDPDQAKLPMGTKDPMKPRDDDGPGSANTRRIEAEEQAEGSGRNGVAGKIGGAKKAK